MNRVLDAAAPALVHRPRTETRTADLLTAAALLNCVLREVSTPAGRVHPAGAGFVRIELPHVHVVLRAETRGSGATLRANGHVWQCVSGHWTALSWHQLARLVDQELQLSTARPGRRGFQAEIATSHGMMTGLLAARPTGSAGHSEYLESEQSLLAGHRFHPAPKARSGARADALRYAPEAGASFRLRYLAVEPEILWQREAFPGAAGAFDGPPAAIPDDGGPLVPLHPWQFRILMEQAALPAALQRGIITDLGELGDHVHPTSSVRTVTDHDAAQFLKLSLGVQITNCWRINRRHEAEAAVALSEAFEPLRDELASRFPGTTLMREPAARTVAPVSSDMTELTDQLTVILREGLVPADDHQLVVAAALTEPNPAPVVARLLDTMTSDTDTLLAYWDRYLTLVIPPVLYAYTEHGVVLEAHLQNVVVGLPRTIDDLEATAGQVFLRDLEGCKLTGDRYEHELAGVSPQARDHLRYDDERGWNRLAYCLFVNHIAGVAAALTDRASTDRASTDRASTDRASTGDPDRIERLLWARVRATLQAYQWDVGDVPRLSDVLAGTPLPAKTNLLTRWHGATDRASTYAPVQLPIG